MTHISVMLGSAALIDLSLLPILKEAPLRLLKTVHVVLRTKKWGRSYGDKIKVY